MFLIFILYFFTSFLFSQDYSETQLSNYIKLYEQNPGDFELCNKIGVLYENLGNFEEAKKYFLISIYLNNNYYEGFNNLGLWYYNRGDYNNAIKNFKTAIEISSNRIDSYINLMNSYIKLNDLNNASEVLNWCLNNFSDNYEILNLAGILSIMKGYYNSAVNYFERAYKLEKDDRVGNNLGVALYLAGRRKEAKKILTKISKNDIIKENLKLIEKK